MLRLQALFFAGFCKRSVQSVAKRCLVYRHEVLSYGTVRRWATHAVRITPDDAVVTTPYSHLREEDDE
ncbi:hypothetical protein [Polaromonas jejuensis]|uniref:Transposase n=1 Tax=Polaromonas jejuensis TaxID=457502 RepID=A0ABW0QD99_9BURK|nr:hypothetical protein [Polaromonas jejuensis]